MLFLLPRKPGIPCPLPKGQVSASEVGEEMGPSWLETAAWEKESASNHIITAVPRG